jgi:hypothetical protein
MNSDKPNPGALIWEAIETWEKNERIRKVDHKRFTETTSVPPVRRAKIQGGWLVRDGEGMTYVPDPEFLWKVPPHKP